MASVFPSGGWHFFVTSLRRFLTRIWCEDLSRTAKRLRATKTADAPAPRREPAETLDGGSDPLVVGEGHVVGVGAPDDRDPIRRRLARVAQGQPRAGDRSRAEVDEVGDEAGVALVVLEVTVRVGGQGRDDRAVHLHLDVAAEELHESVHRGGRLGRVQRGLVLPVGVGGLVQEGEVGDDLEAHLAVLDGDAEVHVRAVLGVELPGSTGGPRDDAGGEHGEDGAEEGVRGGHGRGYGPHAEAAAKEDRTANLRRGEPRTLARSGHGIR